MNPNDLLSKAAKSQPKTKGKGKTPGVNNLQIDAAIDSWLVANRELKDAEARMARHGEQIRSEAEVAHHNACVRDGKYESSVKLNDKVVVSVKNQYSDIDVDHEDELKAIFGDKYDDYFRKKNVVAMTDAAMNDADFLKKLVEVFGDDVFAERFSVKQVIKPTEVFHEQRCMKPDVHAKGQEAISQGLVTPYKPTIKPA